MGLTKVNSAVSFLRFTKDGKSQKLIHEIKYRKKQELAKHLGYLFGQDLLAANYSLPDVLVPVPLHPKKEKRRGFNQSAIFAHGLSLALKIPVVLLYMCTMQCQCPKAGIKPTLVALKYSTT